MSEGGCAFRSDAEFERDVLEALTRPLTLRELRGVAGKAEGVRNAFQRLKYAGRIVRYGVRKGFGRKQEVIYVRASIGKVC